MPSSNVRILVVEDSKPFQGVITSILRDRSTWQVIGIVSDGIEAIRLARQLKPDVIILDIGLPKMNGVKAARQIRIVAPDSKIVFFSQESSIGVVQEALALGARAYITKQHANRELIPAIEAVLEDRLFIGSGLADDDLVDAVGLRTWDWSPKKVISMAWKWTRNEPSHEVQFYSESELRLQRVTRFVETAITGGHAVIVCAMGEFRGDLRSALMSRGLDVNDLAEHGTYTSLDVAETISTVTVEGSVDPVRFSELFRSLVNVTADNALGEAPRVAVYNECAPLLWAEGRHDSAIRVEQLWNKLSRRQRNLDILCGYPLSHIHGDDDIEIVKRVCDEHSRVHSE